MAGLVQLQVAATEQLSHGEEEQVSHGANREHSGNTGQVPQKPA